VTCLARGFSGAAPDGVELVRADRSRPGAYDALGHQRWDVVVDVARQPGQVRSAVRALADPDWLGFNARDSSKARRVGLSTRPWTAEDRRPRADFLSPMLRSVYRPGEGRKSSERAPLIVTPFRKPKG
jgi:hypothetical protein